MPSSTRNRLLRRILQDFKLKTLQSSDLAAFCERGFEAVGAEVSFDLNIRCPNKNLVVSLFPPGRLFDPEEDDPPYAKGGNIFVFSPNNKDRVAGIVLARTEKQWRAWPDHKEQDYIVEHGRFYSINIDWIEVLLRIAVPDYNAALEYDDNIAHEYWDFFIELHSRTNFFRFKLKPALFRNSTEFLTWSVALFWDHWETENVTPNNRVLQLNQTIRFEITVSMFELLSPAFVLRSMERTTSILNSGITETRHGQEGLEIAAEMSRHRITFHEVFIHGYNEYQQVYSKDHLFFSFGGPPELSFDSGGKTSQLSLLGPALNESILRDQLWWWREIPRWPELATKVFFDNFELSSFNYELAARCVYNRNWEPFCLPWVKLANFQRGMLNTMWPTKRYGRHTFIQERSLGHFQHDEDHVLVPIDLRVPQADVLSMVTEIHRRERIKRQMPEPGGRRKKEESSPWEIIELLDRKQLLSQHLKPSEERSITDVIERLYEDCVRLGIKVGQ